MKDAAEQSQRQAALDIVSHLVHNGYTGLYAGGCVRDMLMGNDEGGDVDIVTNATPQTVSSLFKHTVAVGAQFGVVVVVHRGIPFEVATFRSDIGTNDGRHPSHIVFTDAEHDALRRDFTINGMFFNPLTGTVYDYVSGKRDLAAKVVRAIGDPAVRFREDYLRLLRAVRFAARFGFVIEDATWRAIQESAARITEISPERVFAEHDRMLRKPNPDRAFRLLAESGLLAHTVPEVAGLIDVAQPPEFHPEGDAFVHTVKALGLMGPGPSQVLAWSVLLHDIGKKATMRVADRIRFNNHDQVGARMAEAVLLRLRAPTALVEAVSACIDNHMNFMNVTAMRLSTLKKFLSRPTIADELELHRVDCLASHGNIDNYNFVKNKLEAFALEQLKPPPLLRGNDLIDFGLTPGPLFGAILDEIYDLQLEEKIQTRDEALAIVKQKWVDKKG
jgi:putative nucleotidyltransferase with HDIG domain